MKVISMFFQFLSYATICFSFSNCILSHDPMRNKQETKSSWIRIGGKFRANLKSTVLKCSMSIVNNGVSNGIIIGNGRIGDFLYNSNKCNDILISSRTQEIPQDGEGPIYICTRNNDLEKIIQNTPKRRLDDLVFLQNGILTEYLQSKNLSDNTQGLIYFAITKVGEPPIDGITELSAPQGLTAVFGKWSNDFACRLHNAGLTCRVLDKNSWNTSMLEKHIWLCAFMAVGSKYKCSVGDVISKHETEIRNLISELSKAASKAATVSFPPGIEERLIAYARAVSHFPTALKELEWRNQWFLSATWDALDIPGGVDPCPMHTDIIKSTDPKLFEEAFKLWNEKNMRKK